MKMPVSQEHEKVVLAGMMNDERMYYDALAEVDKSFFSSEELGELYGKLVEFGALTANSLSKKEKDPRKQSLIRVVDSLFTGKNDFDFSLSEMKNTYYKRQLYHTLKKVESIFDESGSEEVVSILERGISDSQYSNDDYSIVDPKERAMTALEEFYEGLENPDSSKGMPFSVTGDNGFTVGFPSLDRALNGAYGGDLIMIAAKTGVGKTGFALNLANLFSFRQDYRGYYINTEMRLGEMEARMLAQVANVKANEILYRQLEGTAEEIEAKKKRIAFAYNEYHKSKIVLSRIPDLPLHKATGLSKQVKSRYGDLDYIIVDYIGRMEIAGENMKTWDELYEITKQLKELAMRLDVPVFILAQRNQAGDVEGAKKMMNECDAVLYFEPTDEEDEVHINANLSAKRSVLVNYKIVKQKVRRDFSSHPIYVMYDRGKNFINEIS